MSRIFWIFSSVERHFFPFVHCNHCGWRVSHSPLVILLFRSISTAIYLSVRSNWEPLGQNRVRRQGCAHRSGCCRGSCCHKLLYLICFSISSRPVNRLRLLVRLLTSAARSCSSCHSRCRRRTNNAKCLLTLCWLCNSFPSVDTFNTHINCKCIHPSPQTHHAI